jgi:hypothetical protein
MQGFDGSLRINCLKVYIVLSSIECAVEKTLVGFRSAVNRNGPFLHNGTRA